MQWLIDIVAQRVIDTIGIPPCFIDRGDPSEVDLDETGLTIDGEWHDLDLSSIVPAGATAVVLGVLAKTYAVPKLLKFRKNGNVNDTNVSRLTTQVSESYQDKDFITPIDANRIIEYNIDAGDWLHIYITVKGWLL